MKPSPQFQTNVIFTVVVIALLFVIALVHRSARADGSQKDGGRYVYNATSSIWYDTWYILVHSDGGRQIRMNQDEIYELVDAPSCGFTRPSPRADGGFR